MTDKPTKHDYELTVERLQEAHTEHLQEARDAVDDALTQFDANDQEFGRFADGNPVFKPQLDSMTTNRGELRGCLLRVKAAVDALATALEESSHTMPLPDDDAPQRQTGPDDPSHPQNWRQNADKVPTDATQAESKREGNPKAQGATGAGQRQTAPTGSVNPNAPQARVIPEQPTDNPSRQNERPGGAPKPLDRPENKPKH